MTNIFSLKYILSKISASCIKTDHTTIYVVFLNLQPYTINNFIETYRGNLPTTKNFLSKTLTAKRSFVPDLRHLWPRLLQQKCMFSCFFATCPGRAVNSPCLQILRIEREGMIGDVMSHGQDITCMTDSDWHIYPIKQLIWSHIIA